MTATTALTTGQRLLLAQLADQGRIYRRGDTYELKTVHIVGLALTGATVQTLVEAGLVAEVESYGKERSVYELSDLGLAKSTEMHHS